MEREKNAWQRRAASVYIHVLLTRRDAVRYLLSTKSKYSKYKSTTLYIPVSKDWTPKRYQLGEVHNLPSRVVTVLDAELLHWRSPCSSTATYHLLLDTQSQKCHELGEAGFYASSSQKPQPLHLFLSASNLQSFLVILEFGFINRLLQPLSSVNLGTS